MSPIQISGIHHVGIPVSDFERSLAFYAGVLGLEQIQHPKTWNVRWLRMGDQHIHLQKWDMSKLGADGPRHFALYVKDANAARQHLKSKGYSLDEQPTLKGAERFYVKDPDGNNVELIQWLEDWGDGSRQ